MRRLMLLGAALAMVGCTNQPPVRGAGGAPVGTTQSGSTYVAPGALGPGGINRDYYQGGDPNFPRGTLGGGRR